MIQSIGNQAISLAPQIAAQSSNLLASISRVALSALSGFATALAASPALPGVVFVAVVVIALLLIFKSATGQPSQGPREGIFPVVLPDQPRNRGIAFPRAPANGSYRDNVPPYDPNAQTRRPVSAPRSRPPNGDSVGGRSTDGTRPAIPRDISGPADAVGGGVNTSYPSRRVQNPLPRRQDNVGGRR